MKRTAVYPQPRHDAGATQVVGHAGGLLLTKTVVVTGLTRGLSKALMRWRKPFATHDPGKIVSDLVITLALGGDCLADVALLRAEPAVYGLVASDPTVTRLISLLAADAPRVLKAINSVRAEARARAWRLAGQQGPRPSGQRDAAAGHRRRRHAGWSHDWQSKWSHEPGSKPATPVPCSWQATTRPPNVTPGTYTPRADILAWLETL